MIKKDFQSLQLYYRIAKARFIKIIFAFTIIVFDSILNQKITDESRCF